MELVILKPEEVQKFMDNLDQLVELTKMSDVESAMLGRGGTKNTEAREELMLEMIGDIHEIILNRKAAYARIVEKEKERRDRL